MATQATITGKDAYRTAERQWMPIAAVLLGTGWGSNQITPMLLVYHRVLGLGTGTLEAMFGFYALGLIPGLLLAGPLSDARGRRAVVVPAAAGSLLASLALVAGSHAVPFLFLGRVLAGISSGAAFGAGTAWLREVSCPPLGSASAQTAARRAVIAMTAGFALGPLIAGLLAQWVPASSVVAYLPHIAFALLALLQLRNVAETVSDGVRPALRAIPPGLRNGRFRGVVAPMAPWIFAAPAIAFALLPSVVGADRTTDGVALTATITALCALAGVMIQPLARRLEARSRSNRAATAGLLIVAGGLGLGAFTAHSGEVWLLLPCSIVLGSAYGLCLVAGLIEVQRLADRNGLASLTAWYYALAYLGFAAPYALALGAHLASYSSLLGLGAVVAVATALLVGRRASTRC